MKTTKIFLDTEFTGLHQETTLISLALITETGEFFYAEFTDYDTDQVNEWIQKNVIENLDMINQGLVKWSIDDSKIENVKIRGDETIIALELETWIAQFERIEIWSDCLAYDWMLFCNLFGGALFLPKNIYYIPFDICTSFKDKGIDPDISREEFAEVNDHLKGEKHNALWDATVIKECYEKLYQPEIKEFPVWIEGYKSGATSEKAKFLGVFDAKTFIEACEGAAFKEGLDWNELYDEEGKQWWSTGMFDNEADARKSHG